MIPIVSIVGKSDAGKTTLLEKVVRELRSRGWRIATVKHDAHSFEIDHEGKDSWRHRKAGACMTIISSPSKIAVVADTDHDYSLNEIRDRFVQACAFDETAKLVQLLLRHDLAELCVQLDPLEPQHVGQQ